MIDRWLDSLDSQLERNVLERATFLKKVPLINRPRNFSIILLILLGIILGAILQMTPAAVPEPHVSLAAEPVAAGGPEWFTNSLLTTIIVDIIILVAAILAATGLKMVPENGWSNFMEWAIEGIYNLTESVAGHHARRFFPWAMTIFLLVIVSNYFGLLPLVGSVGLYHNEAASEEHGIIVDSQIAAADNTVLVSLATQESQEAQAQEGEEEHAAEEEEHHAVFVPFFRSPSADLNFTLALALISVIMTQFWGVYFLGAKYFGKFFANPVKRPMPAVVGFFELIAEISKIISFSFRLFGNIFAGEVVLLVMAFLVPFLLPMVFYGLEIFIGFIQALVFMLLTLAFFSMATISHDDHASDHSSDHAAH